jgi:hypothetical protein
MTLRRNNRRGSTLLEVALVASFVLIPLTLGGMTIGMTMARAVRIYDLNRDADHMFARGVDFSVSDSRNLVLRLGSGLNITDTGGSGVIILSEFTGVGGTHAVCTRRLVIGNATLRGSSFANPSLIDSKGNVDFTKDPAAMADSFLNVMPLADGEVTHVAETYYRSSDYDWAGFLTGNGTYTRAVF